MLVVHFFLWQQRGMVVANGIASALGIKPVYHILSEEDVDGQFFHAGISFGERAGRLVRGRVTHLLELPDVKKLDKITGDPEARREAWSKLQSWVKRLKETDTNKQYYKMKMGDKTVCIYKGEKPNLQNVDLFLTETQLELLMELKDLFGIQKLEFVE